MPRAGPGDVRIVARRAVHRPVRRAVEHRHRAARTGGPQPARRAARPADGRRAAVSGSLRSSGCCCSYRSSRARPPLSVVPLVVLKAALAIGAVAVGQPARAAGVVPAGGAERPPRSVSAGGAGRQHRHGLGQLAARYLDGARRISRRPGARRGRVQPPGACRDPAAARHPRRPVLHLARDAGRFRRDHGAAADDSRGHAGADRSVKAAVAGGALWIARRRCASPSPPASAWRRSASSRSSSAAPGSRSASQIVRRMAGPARRQHRDDAGDAGARRDGAAGRHPGWRNGPGRPATPPRTPIARTCPGTSSFSASASAAGCSAPRCVSSTCLT